MTAQIQNHGFDAIDLRILDLLQREARITNLALANAAGISPSPCLRRVRRLEERGVIRSYESRLEPQKVGLAVMALVSIRIQNHGEDDSAAFKKAVLDIPEVIAAYAMTGPTDFMLQVVAIDLPAYSKLMMTLGGIAGVRDIESSIAIETVKPHSALPLSQLRTEDGA